MPDSHSQLSLAVNYQHILVRVELFNLNENNPKLLTAGDNIKREVMFNNICNLLANPRLFPQYITSFQPQNNLTYNPHSAHSGKFVFFISRGFVHCG